MVKTDGHIIKDPVPEILQGDISVLGGDLWILEKTGSTYYTKFATGDQSADVSYVLPTAQGGASTYLQNDGSGNLSWATVATYAGADTQVMYNDGGTALGGDANFTWTKGTYTLQLRQPANDAVGVPIVILKSRSGTGAAGQDGDDIGTISFKSYDDTAVTPVLTEYAYIKAEIADASNTTEDGKLSINLIKAGTPTDILILDATQNYTAAIPNNLVIGASTYATTAIQLVLSATGANVQMMFDTSLNASKYQAGVDATGFFIHSGAYLFQVSPTAIAGSAPVHILGTAQNGYRGAGGILYLSRVYNDAVGATIDIRKHRGAIAVANDELAVISIQTGYDANNWREYVKIVASVADATLGSEDAKYSISTITAGTLRENMSLSSNAADFYQSIADANGYTMTFTKSRGAAGQDGDDIGTISFKSYNDAGTPELIEYGKMLWEINDATDGQEGSKFTMSAYSYGTSYPVLEVSEFTYGGSIHYSEVQLASGFSFASGQYSAFGINCTSTGGNASGFYYANAHYGDHCAWARVLVSGSITDYAANYGTHADGAALTVKRVCNFTTGDNDYWYQSYYCNYGLEYLRLEPRTYNGAGRAPQISIWKKKAASYGGAILAGADNDYLGFIKFFGYNDNASPQEVEFAQIFVDLVDASDNTEDGRMSFKVMDNGTLETMLAVCPGGLQLPNNPTAPAAILADNAQVWGADYAAGDARLYVMGELNTNKLALGAGRVHLDSSLADDSASGTTHTAICGEALTLGDVCYRKSDGKYYKADADASTTMPGVVLCLKTTALPTGGADVTTTQSTKTYAGTGLGTGYQVVGDIITFAGFVNGDSNGAKTVATIGSGSITVDEAIGADESAVTVTWTENDATCEFLSRGFYRDDSLYALTVGGLLYVDTATAGAVTQTAPSGDGDIKQVVGYAYTADIIFFDPQLTMAEV